MNGKFSILLVRLAILASAFVLAIATVSVAQTEAASNDAESELVSFATGILSTIRSAEAAYYAHNGCYANFVTLTKDGYLNEWFASGEFDREGVKITLDVPSEDKQYFYARADIEGLMGWIELYEPGEITNYINDRAAVTYDYMSTIRSAEAAYYAKNGNYADFAVLTKDGYLSEQFASGVFDHKGIKITIEVAGEDKQAFAVHAEADGEYGYMELSENGWINDCMSDPGYIVEGALSSVRAAEAAFYAANGHYGDFTELAAGGFLDSRFESGTFAHKGVTITFAISVDGQSYKATANSEDLFDCTTLDETGEMTVTIIDLERFAKAILSTVRSAEAAYYAANGNYGFLEELAGANYLDERFASGVFNDSGVEVTLKTSMDGQEFRAVAIIAELGIEITLDQTGG